MGTNNAMPNPIVIAAHNLGKKDDYFKTACQTPPNILDFEELLVFAVGSEAKFPVSPLRRPWQCNIPESSYVFKGLAYT